MATHFEGEPDLAGQVVGVLQDKVCDAWVMDAIHMLVLGELGEDPAYWDGDQVEQDDPQLDKLYWAKFTAMHATLVSRAMGTMMVFGVKDK